MKLPDIIILSLAVVFIIIGIHQTMVLGFADSYWAVMLSFILFFIYSLRKRRA
jgi:hypothetical protein